MINSINSNSTLSDMLSLQASQSNRGPQAMFNKIDSDGDGGINQAEFEQVAAKISEMTGNTVNFQDTLATYDADGNGTLSATEMDSFMKDNAPPPPPDGGMGMEESESNSLMSMLSRLNMNNSQASSNMFDDIDSDGNGSIDASELQTLVDDLSEMTGQSLSADDIMAEYDTDNDGVLAKEELGSFMQDNAPPPPPMMQGTGQDNVLSLLNQLGMSNAQPPGNGFGEIDSDGNGSIDSTELQSMLDNISEMSGESVNAADIIAGYDTDGDGALNEEEMGSYMQETRPPFQMQQALSAYGSGIQMEELLNLFNMEQAGSATYSPVSVLA